MKKTIAALIFVSVLSAPALSYADTMENGYDNTFVVTAVNGQSQRFMFNRDNTFAVILPDGSQGGGTWRAGDGQLCLTPGGGSEGCVPLAGDKNVGDTWQQTGTDGSAITVTLERGRQTPMPRTN